MAMLKPERTHAITALLLPMLMLLGMLLDLPAVSAQGKGGVLRIGMTAADIPYTGATRSGVRRVSLHRLPVV